MTLDTINFRSPLRNVGRPNPAFNRTRCRRGLNCLARSGGGAGPVN